MKGGKIPHPMQKMITLSFFVALCFSGLLAQCPQYDFSHIEAGFELDCDNTPLVIQAIIDGEPAAAILWTFNGNVLSVDNVVTINQPGQYNLIVTGQDGCVENVAFTVTSLGFAQLPSSLSLNGCIGDPNPSYCLDLFDDSWTVQWSNGETEPCVTNVNPGEIISATIDNGNCTEVLDLLVPTDFYTAVVNTTSATCELGVAILTITSSIPSDVYVAQFTDGQGNEYIFTLSDDIGFTLELPPGDYTGFVQNQFGCDAFTNAFTIADAGVDILDWTIQNVSCFGENDGVIEIFLGGGEPPYTTSWSDGQTGNITLLENLAAGTYAVTVSDANGCSDEEVFTILEPAPIDILLVESGPASCGGGMDGFLQVSVSGGAGNYNYDWSNGWDTSNNTGLAAGDYTLTVTDQNGCQAIADFTVGSGIEVFIDWTNGGDITCLNPEVTLIANPGDPSFAYAWTGPGVDGQTTTAITVTEPGTYTVIITDTNDPSCFGIGSYVVDEFTDPVTADVTQTGGSCNDNFTFDVDVTSGDLPIQVTVSQDGNVLLDFTITTNFVSLGGFVIGEYQLNLQSLVSGCAYSETLIVVPSNDFSALMQFDTAFCNDDLVDMEVIATGGIEPYTYQWSNGATTPSIQDVPGGLYCATVTDAGGCSLVLCENNTVPDLFVIFETEFASCGNADGTIFTFPLGGTPPYFYEWGDGSTEPTLENVAAGVYGLTLTDSKGCTFETEATLNERLDLEITLTGGGDGCEGGEVVVSVTPVIPGYTYDWEGTNGFVFTGTTFTTSENGFYSVAATSDNDPCIGEAFVEITGAESFLTGIDVIPGQCADFSILAPTFGLDVDFEQLNSQWVLPNGDTIQAPDNGLFADVPGLYVYLADYPPTGCTASDSVFLVELGTNCNGVTGRLWADEGNCQLDGTEVPVPGWIIRFETDLGQPAGFALTDANGAFETTLAPGNYIAFPSPWNDDLYYDCPDVQAFFVDAGGNAFVDVFMPYEEECVPMYVNVIAPTLRRCFENDVFIYYCNDGPIVAEDATITIELDPFLLFLDATPAPVSINAHTVVFGLGDLDPFECGTITMNVLASCDAELGQTHCIEATASPNDPCPAPDNWNGANLTLEGQCNGDSLTFIITNDGISPLTEPFQYIVIEDGIMMMSSPVISPVLGVGESLAVSVPANGSTYHFQTTQEPGNPGFTAPTLVVEGCGMNGQGTFTTGLVNLLSLGDASTDWYDIFCRDNTGSFDPNDKMGLPIGAGERHFIEEGTTMAYDIQFQNTGTDTAFTVVIRDTIAPEFDLSSLRMGASSHDYTFTLDSNRTLTITFDDIMLPDSNVDLRGSQGIVSYTIDHVEGIPLGTELRNQAAIYFDFNEPIFTSTTLHTLGVDFLSSLVEVGQGNVIPMTIYPNPVGKNGQLSIQLDISGTYQLEIYNSLGVKVLDQSHQTGADPIQLGPQPAGWYVARALRPDGGFIAINRFVIE